MYPKDWHVTGGPVVKTNDGIVRSSTLLQDMLDFKDEQIKRATQSLKKVKASLANWRAPKHNGKDDRAGDALNEKTRDRDDLSEKLSKYGEDQKVLDTELKRAKMLEHDAKRNGTMHKPAVPKPQTPSTTATPATPKTEVPRLSGMDALRLVAHNRRMVMKRERATQASSGATTDATAKQPNYNGSSNPTTAGTANLKRKARTDEDLDAPPSRKQKRGDDGFEQGNITASTPPPPSRTTTSSKAGTGNMPTSRKDGRTENDRLRQVNAKVSKSVYPPQSSRESGPKKINASALKAAVNGQIKDGKRQPHPSDTGSIDNDAAVLNKPHDENALPPRKKLDRAAKNKVTKRRAPDDDDDDRSSKKQKVEEKPKPRGLHRSGNSCFSNVVIQLLAAALDGKDLDALLGKLSEVDAFNSVRSRDLKEAIQRAASAGEKEKVSAVLHLRELLERLRAPPTDDKDDYASPKMFQQVFAYGTTDGSSSREILNGEEQQDCFLYFLSLFNALVEDKFVADAAALKEQFEVETATQYTCLSCGHETAPVTTAGWYYNINVLPLGEDTSGTTSFDDLLMESKESTLDEDAKCTKCQAAKLHSTTKFTKQPECLVVRVNRAGVSEDSEKKSKAGASKDAGQTSNVRVSKDNRSRARFAISRDAEKKSTVNPKIITEIAFDRVVFLERMKNEDRYALSAVIMHSGDTLEQGHYTIYRKWNDKWFLINDLVATPKETWQLKDATKKEGHSAMMLFKKEPLQGGL